MGRISRKVVGIGYALVLAILAVDAILVYASLLTITRSNDQVDHSRRVLTDLERTLSVLKDAETGQRGYLLTGRPDYLNPFLGAETELNEALGGLRSLTADDKSQQARVAELGRLAAWKLDELRETITLRHEEGLEAALKVVETNRGKELMDQARRVAAQVRAEANRTSTRRVASSRSAVRRTVVTAGVTIVTALLLLLGLQSLSRREEAEKARAAAVLEEQKGLAEFGRDVGFALTECILLEEMLDRCAEATVRHLDAAFARVWTLNEAGDVLELQASAGLYTHTDGAHGRVPVGQYKIGLIAQERKPHLTNAVLGDPRVPAQEWAEREGLVSFAGYPLVVEDRLVGVWALFARHRLSEITVRAMESVAPAIALGIERKRTAEALAASEAWLATTLTSIGDAVIATDGEGRVKYLNPIAEALTGWPQAEAAGRPMEEVFPIINEHNRRPVEHPVARVISEGTIVGLANHTVLIARDGTESPIEDSAAPIKNEQGETTGVVMVFRDVTAERAARGACARVRGARRRSSSRLWTRSSRSNTRAGSSNSTPPPSKCSASAGPK